MERIPLNLVQLQAMETLILYSTNEDPEIVIENVNIENSVIVRIDHKVIMLDNKGNQFNFSNNG